MLKSDWVKEAAGQFKHPDWLKAFVVQYINVQNPESPQSFASMWILTGSGPEPRGKIRPKSRNRPKIKIVTRYGSFVIEFILYFYIILKKFDVNRIGVIWDLGLVFRIRVLRTDPELKTIQILN